MKTQTTITALAATLALAGSAAASPLKTRDLVAADLVAADIVAYIAPTSTSCETTDECRTNEQIGPLLVQAMFKNEIYDPAAMASILALIAFESGDFKYKRNTQYDGDDELHWGQGTSNMQMFEFNEEYARSITALVPQVEALGDLTTKDKKNELLSLVVADEYCFASGSWFYATKCAETADPIFKTDVDKGFEAHMACVLGEGTIAEERMPYWTRAKEAFGIN